MGETITKLPAKVLSHRAQLDASSEMRRSVESVQKAVLELRDIEELPAYEVCSLEEFAPDWIAKHVDPAIKAIESDPALTAAERSARLKVWQEIRKDAQNQVDIIQSALSKWPKLTWCYDPHDGEVTVNYEQLEAIAESKAVLDVPEQATEHWNKLQGIIADIEDLRRWEQEQGVIPVLIGTAVHYSPFAFAEQWASRSNRIPTLLKRYTKHETKSLII